MFGGLDPKKMQGLMKQMGIKQEEIPADRVIIESSENRIVIENPNVQKINVQGKEMFQVTGDVKEEDMVGEISEKDIKLVMEKTGKSEKVVIKALEDADGDIAEAILNLSS